MKAFFALVSLFVSASAFAQCPGVCVPGPGTPSYAVASCQMINSYPNDIKEQTCSSGVNGCMWREAQEVVQCVPGPGTPDYARASCQMINSYPNDIRIQTCQSGVNGCMLQSTCN